MLLGIVGDTHNNLKNISKICEIFNERKVDLVVHTGDVTLPKSLEAFKNLNCKIIVVLGNNDCEEKEGLKKVSEKFNCKLEEEPFKIELSKKVISVLHHPELINNELLNSSDIIFHGHTHRYRNEIINDTLIFNPGECAGIISGKNQIGILDLNTLEPELLNF